jgi:hypothetical protein
MRTAKNIGNPHRTRNGAHLCLVSITAAAFMFIDAAFHDGCTTAFLMRAVAKHSGEYLMLHTPEHWYTPSPLL